MAPGLTSAFALVLAAATGCAENHSEWRVVSGPLIARFAGITGDAVDDTRGVIEKDAQLAGGAWEEFRTKVARVCDRPVPYETILDWASISLIGTAVAVRGFEDIVFGEARLLLGETPVATVQEPAGIGPVALAVTLEGAHLRPDTLFSGGQVRVRFVAATKRLRDEAFSFDLEARFSVIVYCYAPLE